MHLSICVVFLHNKVFFKKILTILLEASNFDDKIARKLPLVILIGWNFEQFKGFGVTRPERDLESSKSDMEKEKTPRMEELESGQQEM